MSSKLKDGIRHRPAVAERGVSLIIVMIVLTIVSLIGVAAIQVSTLSERSARNDRDQQMAWQSAEAALLDAELDVIDAGISTRNATFQDQSAFLTGCGSSGVNQGLCELVSAGKPAWLTVDFDATGAGAPTTQYGTFTGRTFAAGTAGVQPARPPRYVIEPIIDQSGGGSSRDTGLQERKYVYRVTALGYGPRQNIQAVLQMTVRP